MVSNLLFAVFCILQLFNVVCTTNGSEPNFYPNQDTTNQERDQPGGLSNILAHSTQITEITKEQFGTSPSQHEMEQSTSLNEMQNMTEPYTTVSTLKDHNAQEPYFPGHHQWDDEDRSDTATPQTNEGTLNPLFPAKGLHYESTFSSADKPDLSTQHAWSQGATTGSETTTKTQLVTSTFPNMVPMITDDVTLHAEDSSSTSTIKHDEIGKTNTPPNTPDLCKCECRNVKGKWAYLDGKNYTRVELKEKLKDELRQIRENLEIKKTACTSYKNTKISASDFRKSSISIGYVGSVLLATPFALVVLADILNRRA